jgi:Protein of unknown function (DUF2852)
MGSCATRADWREQKMQWKAMKREAKMQAWGAQGDKPSLFRNGWEIAAMVVGFVVFFPIGLAILGYFLWRMKSGHDYRDLAAAMPAGFGNFARPAQTTGNAAFDDWRTAELTRLDEERRKLHDAQVEFERYVDDLKRAKDRTEFEQFMASRKGPTPTADTPDAPAA